MMRNAVVVLASVLLGLGCAEVMVRLAVPVRDVGPTFSVYDPVLGKRLKPSFKARRITPEFSMELTTNSSGFRGAEPPPRPASSILFLGDSFTMGYGVSDGEEFPALVDSEFKLRYGDAAPVVINAGIGNSGNGFWLRFLTHRAPGMQPKLVVLQVFDNDFADNQREGLYSLGPNRELLEHPVRAPGWARRIQERLESIPGLTSTYLFGLLRQAVAARPEAAARVAGASFAKGDDELTFRLVREAAIKARALDAGVIALVVGLSPARKETIRAEMRALGVPVVDIPGKDERPDLYFAVDGHWRAAGHRFAARQLLPELEKHAVMRALRPGAEESLKQ